MYEYKAKVTKVVDGDTFYAEVDLGFFVKINLKFRLADIDTPEIFRPRNSTEKHHGLMAKDFVKELILDKIVTVRTNKTGKYGRWIAYVDVEGTGDLTESLKANFLEKKLIYN